MKKCLLLIAFIFVFTACTDNTNEDVKLLESQTYSTDKEDVTVKGDDEEESNNDL